MTLETVQRIEPARLEEAHEAITDVIADLATASATLGRAFHPRTAANLAGLVRIMNTYYSNLIEGHHTRPKDIERALAGDFDRDRERRNLQIEAQRMFACRPRLTAYAAAEELPEPASPDSLRMLHREFYKDAPDDLLRIGCFSREFVMVPANGVRNPSMMLPLAVTSRLPVRGSSIS